MRERVKTSKVLAVQAILSESSMKIPTLCDGKNHKWYHAIFEDCILFVIPE